MIVRDLVTVLSFQTDPSGLLDAERRLKVFSNNMRNVGINMSMFVTAPIVGLGTAALMASARMETVRASFDVLTGSVEKGGQFMKEMVDFAKVNPLFDVATIGESAKMMMAMGIPAEELIGTMSKMSDVLAGSGVPMGRVAYNLGQIRTQNRATAIDLRQFAMAGIPIYEYLASSLGKNKDQIMEMTRQGKIGYTEVMKAFELMTQKGGRYYGMTERMSKTLSGRFNRLKEQVFLFNQALGDLMNSTLGLGNLLEGMINFLQKGVTWFQQLNPNVQRFGMIVAGVAAAFGPLLLGLATFISLITLLAPIIGTAFLPLLIAAGVFALLLDDFLVWQKGGKSVLGLMLGSYESFGVKVKEIFKTLMADIRKAWKGDWMDLIADTTYYLETLVDKILSTLFFGAEGSKAYREQERKNANEPDSYLGFLSGVKSLWAGIKANKGRPGVMEPDWTIPMRSPTSAQTRPLMGDVHIKVDLGVNNPVGSVPLTGTAGDQFGERLGNAFYDALSKWLRTAMAQYGNG